MKKIITILVLILVVLGGWKLIGGSSQEVSMLEPADVVGEFYGKWLDAVVSPDTALPNMATLVSWPLLGKELKKSIANAKLDAENELDPVLCQSKTPAEISVRNVYTRENDAKILVTSADKSVTNQAIVSLTKLNGGWYMSDIECSPGEFAPEREFTFEETGYLIKASVPKPFDSKNWHLVFEQDGVPGHVVPLIFDSASECTALDGKKGVCKPSDLLEASKASIKGQMTETGAMVKFLELVK